MQLTMRKGSPLPSECFFHATKTRPNAQKNGPKVSLVERQKRLSFGPQHWFSQNVCLRRYAMQWIDPDFCDLRLGFEVTAYVYVR